MSKKTTKLKKFRESNDLTQQQLANFTGVSLMSIRRYENGEREPSLRLIRKMAEALNVPMSELIDDWSAFSNEEIVRDMADEDNEYFWTSYLEDKLKQIGFGLGYDEDNAALWIDMPDGSLEVTDSQLRELDDSLVSYLEFKLDEMRKNHPDDFRPRKQKPMKRLSTKERLNAKD